MVIKQDYICHLMYIVPLIVALECAYKVVRLEYPKTHSELEVTMKVPVEPSGPW